MFIIGVTGGTASGKTTIVEEVVSKLNTDTVCVISQDSYNKKQITLVILKGLIQISIIQTL